MSNFVKIGTRRINLDTVAHIEQDKSDPDTYHAYLNVASEGWIPSLTFTGDEAKLLLAIVDQDDERVDALIERMYRKPEPEPAIITNGGWLRTPDVPNVDAIDIPF